MEEHRRRKRYSGTHPKTFAEKYKEHDPEKYADTVARVISKGSTPAGMHLSIMVEEVLEVVRPTPEECRANGRARSTKLRWAVRA